MKTEGLFQRALGIIQLLLFIWTFMVFAPYEDIRVLGDLLGRGKAIAGEVSVSSPYSVQPPYATDLSEPSGVIKYSWARVAGNESAVYLNIPGNQLSKKIELPRDPSPLVLGKYDSTNSVGQIALMRIRQVGGNIQAEIRQLSPRDFGHFFTPHLYNFALLDWNPSGDPSCVYSDKYLRSDDPPAVNTEEIRKRLTDYDMGRTSIAPTFLLGMEEAKVNRSNLYWHQRINTDPCWQKRGLRDFESPSDGNFHNLSYTGFLNLVALAQHIHKASVSVTAYPEYRPETTTSTSKSFFKKKVTTTVSYYLKPVWTVGTPSRSGTYADYLFNPTWDTNGSYSFVNVTGNHTFPVDETLIYQWTKTESGWTGLFVFVACVVVGVLTGMAGAVFLNTAFDLTLSLTYAGLAGGAAGAVGGLIASGGNPTTSTTAHFTPFSNSSYELSDADTLEGDQAEIASRTFSNWLSPEIMSTPGGVQVFASQIDFRKALACGGASKATDACATPAITEVGMNDPRFNQVYREMFHFPHKELQKHTYPYAAD